MLKRIIITIVLAGAICAAIYEITFNPEINISANQREAHSKLVQEFRSGSYNNIAHFSEGDIEYISVSRNCTSLEYCECWILNDKSSNALLKNDVGQFHKPLTSMMTKFAEKRSISIISISPISSQNYSLLTCDLDYTATKPFWVNPLWPVCFMLGITPGTPMAHDFWGLLKGKFGSDVNNLT